MYNGNKYQSKADYEAILSIVQDTKPSRVLEIGVNRGLTAAYILNNCPFISYYAGVDMSVDGISSMTRQKQEALEVSGHAGEAVANNNRFHLFLFPNGSVGFKPEPFDLVFVDGNHSLEGCRFDTELARMCHAKTIIWHDYVSSKGVTLFVNGCGLNYKHVTGTRVAYACINPS